jgi:hypothetical protein
MRVAVYLPLLFPLLSAPLARAVAARVEPRLATWLLTLAAVMFAGTSCGALGLLALSALVRIPLVAQLGDLSLAIMGRGESAGGAIALVAGVLFGVALAATVAFTVRRARALTDAFRHARTLPGRGEVVVTRDAAADAYTVPGLPGRIVVSAGMLDALDQPGRAALLAHERAHLMGRHYLFTSAAFLAAAANPLVRPLAAAVEYTVERWADERAAAEVGDRRLLAQTIAHAALATKATRPSRPLAAALGAVFGRSPAPGPSLSGAGPVPRRVAALLAPPPGRRLLLSAAAVVLVAAAAVCALEAANDLQDLLSLAHVHDG